MESSCRVEIIQITDTMRQENLKKSYIKEQINQLLQETNANGTKDYAYDHRGNLLSVTSGEEEKEKFLAIQSIKFKTNFYIILFGYGIHMEK